MRPLLIFLLFTSSLSGQVHVSIGHTDISRQAEGFSFNWSIGITQVNRDGHGFKLNYKSVMTDVVDYKNIDFGYVHRYQDNNYRMDLYVLASYENVNKDVNPLVGIRNSIKLWADVWLVVDGENTFKIGSESHSYFMAGFSWDL